MSITSAVSNRYGHEFEDDSVVIYDEEVSDAWVKSTTNITLEEMA